MNITSQVTRIHHKPDQKRPAPPYLCWVGKGLWLVTDHKAKIREHGEEVPAYLAVCLHSDNNGWSVGDTSPFHIDRPFDPDTFAATEPITIQLRNQ